MPLITTSAPHGLTATDKDRVNADLLAFCRQEQQKVA
jgi:hypothetical protein